MTSYLDAPSPLGARFLTGHGDLADSVASVRRIGIEVAGVAAPLVDRDARFPTEAIGALRGERLLSPGIPKRLGGLGAPLADLCEMTAALSQHCASTGMIFAMHQIQVACLVHHAAGTRFFDDFLSTCEEQQLLIASATSEVGTGGDIGTSIACVVPDGSHIRLHKQCAVVSYAEHADAVLATARRSNESASGDQVLVLLRRPSFQLTRTSEWNPMGMRGTCSPGFELTAYESSDVLLPHSARVAIAQTVLPWSHVLWASVWLGIATAAVERARITYRRAAGAYPDGGLPFSAPRVVGAFEKLDQLQSLVRDALNRIGDCAASPVRHGPTFTMAMNNLKLSGSRLVTSICMDSLAACGMAGYSNDSPTSIAQLLRDACSANLMISNERLAHTNATLALLARVEGHL